MVLLAFLTAAKRRSSLSPAFAAFLVGSVAHEWNEILWMDCMAAATKMQLTMCIAPLAAWAKRHHPKLFAPESMPLELFRWWVQCTEQGGSCELLMAFLNYFGYALTRPPGSIDSRIRVLAKPMIRNRCHSSTILRVRETLGCIMGKPP